MTKTDKFDETGRIKALKRYDILDTPPEGSFDNITRLAAQLLNVPVAIVSLVDTDRIWFKSSVGLDDTRTIDRRPGLCASAILSDDFYMVEDAVNDPRTLSNPLVTGNFGLRFYAAAPLKIREGFNLGALCIIDRNPRTLRADEKDILQRLAVIVTDQLELRLEARKANTRQNQLLSMVAHELRNPLTTIPAYAELIRTQPMDKSEIETICNHITRASDRMATLIKEILEMAKTNAEEILLKKDHFDFASVLGRVTATNLVLANSKQQKLYLDIQDTVMMNADETRMTEVAENLINNAIKYSPHGAEIRIRLKGVDDKAIFEVVDQGPGLTADDQEKLFTPFTKLSARPTGGENSTGIGLSIVRMLVQAHGGRVMALNNGDAAGATFRVEIPASDRPL